MALGRAKRRHDLRPLLSGSPAGGLQGRPDLHGHPLRVTSQHEYRVPEHDVTAQDQAVLSLVVVRHLAYVSVVSAVDLNDQLPFVEAGVEVALASGGVPAPQLARRDREPRTPAQSKEVQFADAVRAGRAVACGRDDEKSAPYGWQTGPARRRR